jgi:hypothetical protein
MEDEMTQIERTETGNLPVVVIGAGPIGLAAAAHLLSRGEVPVVLEAGAEVGANIRQWAHVRLFSPWEYNVDPVSAALLRAGGWQDPDPQVYPTGGDLVERYLVPLAGTPELRPHIRLGARVTAVTRVGFDKMKSKGRERSPFLVMVETADGREEAVTARAVIDASGTWGRPNPLGAGGIPAPGERAASDRIFYGIPDVLGVHRERYAGKRVLVVGSGHSAFNAIQDLVTLAGEDAGTSIVWAVRRPSAGRLFGGGENDQLVARGLLGLRLRQLVGSGAVRLVTGFRALQVVRDENGLTVAGEKETLSGIDEIVVVTGARPDLSILSELRLDLDPAVESPSVLAPLIDPNLHSCGTVRPHGAEELKHPEEGFFIVGMKSYGRAPTFLLRTGYEQVRSVVSALAGDWESARETHLELPETGVCTLAPLKEAVEEVCCGPALVALGSKAVSRASSCCG